mmetsp:Transcript_18009/g.55403  ORF Transcript_18009/g.55403 Transcript_18009/m.55403 type:complete len:243 (-) Transcript_18009:192-920(-)
MRWWGLRSFRSARISQRRTQSLVSPHAAATWDGVRASPVARPNRSATTRCSSGSKSWNASLIAPCNNDISTARSAPGSRASSVSSSFSWRPDARGAAALGLEPPVRAPPVNRPSTPPTLASRPRGVSVETASPWCAAVRTRRSLAGVMSNSLASSSSDGLRPFFWLNSRSARDALARSWCTCIGRRMSRDWNATALRIACWIHQQAYVENLQPRAGSNLVAARINPSDPSWTRSERPMPRFA